MNEPLILSALRAKRTEIEKHIASLNAETGRCPRGPDPSCGNDPAFLKVELKRAEITYEELAKRLARHGMTETKASIANKLARGAFTARFFLAALTEIGCEVIRLEEV